ncbi:hypothetical protein LCGC14_2502740 [marine sediment metagenome]|uniref:Uncharacterized protein n=1 Tax=marine sediment metagenome TaxID=412755 RepID=A0A0F9DD82_9ZZZZ
MMERRVSITDLKEMKTWKAPKAQKKMVKKAA